MNGVVLDASMALSWCFEDEHDELSERALSVVRDHGGVVTPLWWLEIGNVLLQAEKRGQISPAESVKVLSMFDRLPLESSELDPHPSHLLTVARSHALTSYEASYLIAAELHGCHLATRDGALMAAARVEGVPLLQ